MLKTTSAIAVSIIIVIIGLVSLNAFVRFGAPMIDYNGDGSKMVVYGNVITTSEGLEYRVTVSTHYEPGKKPVRIVDMYTLEDRLHASITGIMHNDLRKWSEIYHCSAEEIRDATPCPHDDFVSRHLLDEALEKTMIRENAIGNLELMWSWDMGTKELTSQIQ